MPGHQPDEGVVALLQSQFAARNRLSADYIPRHSERLARVSREMAERFRNGGRLLAMGVGPYSTDAQHVSVEFVHPVIVGKRALPALDLSSSPEKMLAAILQPQDIVMAFAPPAGSAGLEQLVQVARARGALTCLWPGWLGDDELPPATDDPFIHQELTEVMYHTLWETVHVFLDWHSGHEDVGAASFLYPFLGEQQTSSADDTLADVAASIRQKAAQDERLRSEFVNEQAEVFVWAVRAVRERIAAGGAIVAFGNGGSATDANDLVLDCVDPPPGLPPITAISLSMEPANLSAIANDVGVELMFQRQLIAHGRPQDVAVAISTSGKSKNLTAALAEARKRGMLTLGFAGYDGGDFVREKLVDHAFVVHCDYIPRIQEVQASIYHVLRLALGPAPKGSSVG
ncbi:MAG TPA: SIS domain-containing protein [Pirellulales bacterium]|nr:SIS domain-containing protein [Pirellulales bacterium]